MANPRVFFLVILVDYRILNAIILANNIKERLEKKKLENMFEWIFVRVPTKSRINTCEFISLRCSVGNSNLTQIANM